MFGYRLLRERDYDRLQTQLVEERTRNLDLQASLLQSAREAASAQTHRDQLVTRVNVLEAESAQLRHKLTGLPTIAPQIEKGRPLRASEIGAGVDLFEDVGDEKARELRDAGLLHDDLAPMPEFPSAEAMSASATGAKVS